MGMFTNFSKTTHPDNRFEFLPKEKVDEIIIGASCKHVFKIPFSYTSIVESGVVMILFNVEHDILRRICSIKVGITHNTSNVVEEG